MLALALLLANCSSEPARPPLVDVPIPDVSTAEAGVQKQIADTRARLAELLASRSAAPADIAQAFNDLGLLYLTFDFLEAAEACITNARRQVPEDFRWPYLLAYLNKVQGNLEVAKGLFEEALELEADYLPALLRLGRTHLELGDHAAARQTFARALELEATSAAALEGLGRVADATGDLAAAADFYERALEAAPTASSLHYSLGQVYRRLGDLDRARASLAESGDEAVRVPDPLINPLANLAAGAQFYLIQAGEAMEKKDYPSAAAAYQKALEQDPTNLLAHKGLGYCLQQLGDLPGAVAQLRRALATEADGSAEDRRERADIQRVLGGLEVLSGRDGEAIAAFSAALELDPDLLDARLKLANALSRQRRFADAVSHYDRVFQARPELADVLVKRATALVNLDRRQEAIADFERAIAAAPDSLEPRLRYAAALDHFGDTAAAAAQRAAAEELGGSARDKARLAASSGRQAQRLGDLEGAVAGYREALAASPELTEVRYQLAAVLADLGRFDAALVELRRIIESDPRHAAARRGEITALILAGRFGEARVQLNDSLRLFPRDAQLALTQARLLASVPEARVRDGRLALAVAQKLYEFHPRDPQVRETLAMALAAAGRPQEAAAAQRQLLAVAESSGRGELLAVLRAQLRAYESGEAWTATSPRQILAAPLASAEGP